MIPIDLNKLSPAPWTCGPVHKESEGKTWLTFTEQMEIFPPDQKEVGLDFQPGGPVAAASVGEFSDNGLFIALARNAFDVMMRRRWYPSCESLWSDPERKDKRGWVVRELHSIPRNSAYQLTLGRIIGELGMSLVWADDPFTALVEADAWYAANVEGKPA